MRDHDAADDRRVNVGRDIVGEKISVPRITPTRVQRQTQQHDVEPIGQQGDAIADEFGEQRCGKRDQANGAEK